jgi:hypothetical protein
VPREQLALQVYREKMDLLERLAQLALPVRVVFRETLVQLAQQVLRVQQDLLV